LFDLNNELFVGAAYLRLLGRPADPAGYLNYLQLLRSGASRARIVAALQSSKETGAAAPDDDNDRLIGIARGLSTSGASAKDRRIVARHLRELLALDGALFVEAAAAAVIEGGLDAGEAESFVTQLASGRAKTEVLRQLLLLPGARPLRVTLPLALRARLLCVQWAARLRQSTPPPRRIRRPAPVPAHAVGRETPASHGMSPQPVLVPLATAQQALFTIASRNYLAYVRTLMRSVRAAHPEWLRYVLIVDEPAPMDAADDNLFTTVHACQLGIPSFDDMSVRYDVLELNTALKPFFFDWLFRHTVLDSVVYLDPDIRLYAPLDRVCDLLAEGASVVLTPHATSPLDAERGSPNDHQFLKTGVFNLGFVAMQRGEESLRFADWWSRHLMTECLVDFPANLFTDQRWCDLAPCLLDRLRILRDPGYNVAYWNVEQRQLHRSPDASWHVGADHLVFFHFSGLDPRRPESISKHQNRLNWADAPDLRALYDDYLGELEQAGWASEQRAEYSYGRFRGARIPSVARRFYRLRNPMPRRDENRATLLAELFDTCFPTHTPSREVAPPLSPLMRFIFDLRTDLARSFDLSMPEGRADYTHWFFAAAVHEYGLVDMVLQQANTGGAP
jgi:hypothetical protein